MTIINYILRYANFVWKVRKYKKLLKDNKFEVITSSTVVTLLYNSNKKI